MPTLRQRILPLSSLALVSAAAVAVLIDAAHAQTPTRVTYGTDPGYAGQGPQILSYRADDAPAPAGDISHEVVAGETVYALARRYDVAPGKIIAKNGLDAPYALNIGQLIVIPHPSAPVLEAPSRLTSVRAERRGDVLAAETRPQPGAFALDRAYRVRQGDTVYSISRRYGLSVRDLAEANGLQQPYRISVDQALLIPGAASPQTVQQQRLAAQSAPVVPDRDALDRKVVAETLAPLPEPPASSPFAWPVRGPVLSTFGAMLNGAPSDGVNIAAPIGAPVRATMDGEVVYRGDELEGYGNLLLIKHDNGWVSAYAHTDAILVRRKDYVRQGQVIAKVGRSGSVERPQLHFQLRKDLQPQDPLMAMQLGGFDEDPLTAAGLR